MRKRLSALLGLRMVGLRVVGPRMAGLGMVALGTVATVAAAPAGAAEVFFYNWTNYFPPELLGRFERETGIHVTLDTYDSNETLLAKLQAGATGYDVIVPSDYIIPVMVEAGLLEELDGPSLPHFKGVSPTFSDPSFDPGRRYTAPYMWGTTGFTYDGKRVPGGRLEESWKAFFEPAPELKGQIASLNDEVEVWNAATYYLGVDKCTENPEDAKKILALLEAQKPYLAMYQSDGSVERMIAGEVIMHQEWNGAAHRVKEKMASAVYVYPKEGLSLWQDNLAIAKGAPHKEEAKRFIDWLLMPENAAAVSNFTGYNNGVAESPKFMDAALRDDPAVNTPDDLKGLFRPAKVCGQAARDLRSRVWTRLKK